MNTKENVTKKSSVVEKEEETTVGTEDIKEVGQNTAAEQDVDEAGDMPEPETKEYQKFIRVKPKFKELMEQTLGSLGYNQAIGTPDTNIQVNKLFKIIEEHGEKMTITDMNQFIVLMSLAPWKIIHEFMALIEKPEEQAELWEIYEA